MSKTKLTLKTWIERTGKKKVAQLLDVDSSTVRVWRLGLGLPKARQMYAIKKLSNGELTCDAMIESFHKAQKGQGK